MMTTRLCFYLYWFTADEHKSDLQTYVPLDLPVVHSTKPCCASGLLGEQRYFPLPSEVKRWPVPCAVLSELDVGAVVNAAVLLVVLTFLRMFGVGDVKSFYAYFNITSKGQMGRDDFMNSNHFLLLIWCECMWLCVVQCLARSRGLSVTHPSPHRPKNGVAGRYNSIHNFVLLITCVVHCTIKLNRQQTSPSVGEWKFYWSLKILICLNSMATWDFWLFWG